MWKEYVGHLLINTPLEGLAFRVRDILQKSAQRPDPKWDELRAEDDHIESALPLLINDSTNCLDVGGHLGAMLSKMRRLAKNGVHQVVEPLPYKSEWLRKKFPSVTVHQVAVSDAPGKADFFYQASASGFSGLNVHGEESGATKIEVECKTLDDLWPAATPLGFMKIDIEGGELPALRGASRIVQKWHPAILFECTESGTKAFHYAPSELYFLLTKTYGYKVYKIKDWVDKKQPLTLEEFEKTIAYPARAFNFLAVRG